MAAQFLIAANDDAGATVRLGGRLTYAEHGAFRQLIDGFEHLWRDDVVIDLSDLHFIDSAGMGLLLVARDLAAACGGRVRLGNALGQVARMLQLAKFGDLFTADCAYAQV